MSCIKGPDFEMTDAISFRLAYILHHSGRHHFTVLWLTPCELVKDEQKGTANKIFEALYYGSA